MQNRLYTAVTTLLRRIFLGYMPLVIGAQFSPRQLELQPNGENASGLLLYYEYQYHQNINYHQVASEVTSDTVHITLFLLVRLRMNDLIFVPVASLSCFVFSVISDTPIRHQMPLYFVDR